jgi:Flp pilus assembly protein TadG
MRTLLRSWLEARFWRREDGSSAAEFALVVTPLALMTIGVLQVGFLFYVYNDMHDAAREAVRKLAVDERLDVTDENGITYSCDGSGIPPAINSAAEVACNRLGGGWLDDFTVVTNLGPVPESSFTCRELTVTITVPMASAAIFDMFGVLDAQTMQASATMVTEYTLDGTNWCT